MELTKIAIAWRGISCSRGKPVGHDLRHLHVEHDAASAADEPSAICTDQECESAIPRPPINISSNAASTVRLSPNILPGSRRPATRARRQAQNRDRSTFRHRQVRRRMQGAQQRRDRRDALELKCRGEANREQHGEDGN